MIGNQGMNIAEYTILQQLTNNVIFRCEVAPHRLHTEQVRGSGGLFKLSRLLSIQRQRLFNQQMLSGGNGAQTIGKMVVVGRGDIDRINILPRQQHVETARGMAD